jgi:RNA polymerase sigma-70 factor (ECF subfamily)
MFDRMARAKIHKFDSIPTPRSLLAKVKDLGNQEAWREFCNTYGPLIRRLALSAGLGEDEADEVVQEVFISLTRNIGDFEYDPAKCSFKHWLTNVVRWRIQDQFKKRWATTRAASPTTEDGPAPNPTVAGDTIDSELEALWESEWEEYVMAVALERLKKSVKPKQFQIFFLHVLKQQPPGEVARRLKASRMQVYLAKLRVGRLFRQQVQVVLKGLA